MINKLNQIFFYKCKLPREDKLSQSIPKTFQKNSLERSPIGDTVSFSGNLGYKEFSSKENEASLNDIFVDSRLHYEADQLKEDDEYFCRGVFGQDIFDCLEPLNTEDKSSPYYGQHIRVYS